MQPGNDKHHRRTALLVALLISLGSVAVFYLVQGPGVRQDPILLDAGNGRQISATLFEPRALGKPAAVCILMHGLTADKGSLALIAAELARAGIPALAYDAPQHGYSAGKFPDDCLIFSQTVARWLSQRYPGTGVRMIYIGHSMGAHTISSLLNQGAQIQFVVALGGGAEDISRRPEHVLAIHGWDDEGAIGGWIDKPGSADVRTYSPPLSLHVDEPWHPWIVNRIVTWCREQAGLAANPWTLFHAAIAVACLLLLIAGGVALVGLLLRRWVACHAGWARRLAAGIAAFLIFFALGLSLIPGNFFMILPPWPNILHTAVILALFPVFAVVDWVCSRDPALRHLARLLEGLAFYSVGLLLIVRVFDHHPVFHPLKFSLGYFLIASVVLTLSMMTWREKKSRPDLLVFHLLSTWIWLAQCLFN